jgi:glycosyltransferase involved in cell wall biosynthesis
MSSDSLVGLRNNSRLDEIPKRRPRLLFLAWVFPPAQSIASVRTWNLAKHLSRRGWDITVVTPDPAILRHVENPRKVKVDLEAAGIRRILTGHDFAWLDPGYLTYPNQGIKWFVGGVCRKIAERLGISRGIGWIRPAEHACHSLNSDNVDVILASGPAFAAFVLAERLSKRLGRPYILDYRDPWWTEIPRMFRVWRGFVDKLEGRLIAGCKAAIVVSPSWALDLDRRFGIRSKLHVITNGYDPEDLADVKPYNFDHFAMVYTGIFYPPIRSVTPILAALKRLAAKKGTPDKWLFHYYGEHDDYVRDQAAAMGVADRVKIHGKVPRSEALSAVKGAKLAIVISSVSAAGSPEINGWVPAKLYEAIGLGTPVLLIAPPGSDAEAIAAPTRLVRRFAADDIEGTTEFIERMMSDTEFQRSDSEPITWEYLADQFDRVLRQHVFHSQPISDN